MAKRRALPLYSAKQARLLVSTKRPPPVAEKKPQRVGLINKS